MANTNVCVVAASWEKVRQRSIRRGSPLLYRKRASRREKNLGHGWQPGKHHGPLSFDMSAKQLILATCSVCQREISLLVGLAHRNVLKVMDYLVDPREERVYIVTEWVDEHYQYKLFRRV